MPVEVDSALEAVRSDAGLQDSVQKAQNERGGGPDPNCARARAIRPVNNRLSLAPMFSENLLIA